MYFQLVGPNDIFKIDYCVPLSFYQYNTFLFSFACFLRPPVCQKQNLIVFFVVLKMCN